MNHFKTKIMKITTIEQVLDLAETLNKVYESESVANHEMTIHGIESIEDLKAIAKQEKGNFWEADHSIANYCWTCVKLGDIEFILTNKKI